MSDRALRAASTATLGAATALCTYPLLRVASHLWHREPDPGAIWFVGASGYVWRVIVSLYVGAFVGMACWPMAGHAGAWRIASIILAAGILLLVVQTAFIP